MANKVLLDNHQFTTTLLQINELIAVYGSPIAPAPFSLIIGEQYTVVWDGVEYECTAYDGGAMMTGMVYIGNGSGFNMPGDASQPFVIAEADGTVVVMSLLDTVANTASSHTVSIAYEDVQYAIYHSTLTAIAKSIRDKTGTTEKLSPTAMPTAIEGISGGGGTSSDERVKYVTFMNGATELYKYPVIVGDTCKNPADLYGYGAPTKEMTVSTVYSFAGWSLTDGGSASSSALANVTENRTVWAVYDETARVYRVTYYDEDGTTELKTEYLAYESTPSYKPTKDGSLFDGWIPDITPVTGDVSYTAKWIEVIGGAINDTTGWLFDADTQILSIYGTGSMVNGTYGFQDYKLQVQQIRIEEGITEISGYCFRDFSAATSIRLPSTLTKIGNGAFYGCKEIITYAIPEGVTRIEPMTFYQNLKLRSISFPSTLTFIGSSAFYNCYMLETVTIPASVTHISSSAFYSYNTTMRLASAVFEDTSGWYVTKTEGATSGTDIDVTNPATNATMLLKTYCSGWHWYNT